MCSSEDIIEISDGEDETDMLPLPSAMCLLKKASDLLARPVDSTEKVDLDAVNLLIKRAMDLQNIKQENDVSEPGQVNVISTTDIIVKSEHPSPIEPTIDVPEIKTENVTEKSCSSGQLSAVPPNNSQPKPTESIVSTEIHQKLPDMPDITAENYIEQELCPFAQSVPSVSSLESRQKTTEKDDTAERLPNTPHSNVGGPANAMLASSQTADIPDLTDEMDWDAPTEIRVTEYEVKSHVTFKSDQYRVSDDTDWNESSSSENSDESINAASNIPEDMVLTAMEEEPGPSTSETKLDPKKKSRQSRELARIMCHLSPKTWAIGTRAARSKIAEGTHEHFERWRCCREKQKTPYSNDDSVSQRSPPECGQKDTDDLVDDDSKLAEGQHNGLKRGADMTDITDSQNESIRNPKRQCVSLPTTSTNSSEIDDGEENDGTAIAPLKNDNIKMFATNEMYQSLCVICDTRQRNLVNHYVREHPEMEVLISRISPKSRALALAGLEPATIIRGPGILHQAFCVFCDMYLQMHKHDWIIHFSRHTGEYMYKCVPCDYTFAYKSAQEEIKTCKFIKFRNIHFVDNVLHGYICTLCNFLQIFEAPLIKHCKEQHDVNKPMQTINYNTFKLLDVNVVANPNTQSSIVILNNCLEMYLSNPKYRSACVLCGGRSANIANHYIKRHPGSEIYVSRISSAMCDLLERGIHEAEHIQSHFSALCIFCEKIANKSKWNWIVHLTTHTGEYLYRCDHHEQKISSPHNSCHDYREHKQVLSLEYEDNCFYGYLCKLCNYVQLFEENIIPHVKDQHGIGDTDVRVNYIRRKLLDLNVKKRGQPDESVPSGSSENNQVSAPSTADIISEAISSKSSFPSPVAQAQGRDIQNISTPAVSTADHTYSLRPRVSTPTSATRSNVEVYIITDGANTTNNRDKTDMTHPIPSHSEKSALPVCPQPQPVTERSNLNLLKPWTASSAIKNETLVKFKLNDACLFALFKCMSTSCIYATKSADEMLRHLKHHQLFDDSLDVDGASKLYLECAYCTDVAQSNKELVQHVQDKHFGSIFMCQHCFYRSVDVYGVLVHLRKYHMGMEEVIVIGNIDRMLDTSREVNSLVENRNDNIVPIPSTLSEYFVKDQLVWRLIEEELPCPVCSTFIKYTDIRNHLSSHGIGDFQCLHCPYGSDDVDEMRTHMADFHSNRLFFVWGRRYRRDIDHTSIDPLNVESTVIINIAEAVDNLGVRFREIGESMQNSLNSMILPQFVNPESWSKFIESMDAPMKLHEILRGNILQESSKNLISWTEFNTQYTERESSEMCRKFEDNLGKQIPMLPNLFPHYRHK